ncbi:hypothetical protein KAJ02_08170, partial [Candidatus Bipolaricaulota bacterium]|nr:hypothetical protein [Candidatus Bipolaricaulota bacterium]
MGKRGSRLISLWLVAGLVTVAALAVWFVVESSTERTLALYEPADGLIYHGTAPNPAVVEGYITALDDVAIAPLIEGI